MKDFDLGIKYLRYKNVVFVIISFCLALYLSNLDNSLFRDRSNYLLYLNNIDKRLDILLDSSIIFFEPLFLILNSLLLQFALPENVLCFWVFFVCFSIVYFSFRTTESFGLGILLLLLIFFQPQTFAIMLVTTRQGIGVAILIWSLLYSHNEKTFLVFILVAGFIHNTFLLIAALYLVGLYLNKKNISYKMQFVLIAFISLLINYSFFILLNYLDVRQNYSDFESGAGGGGFVLWSTVLIYLILFKSKHLYSKSLFVRIIYKFSMIGLIIYVTSYFLSPIAGRIIGTFIPFIYFLLVYKMRMIDLLFVFAILVLNIYLFINGGAEGFLEVNFDIFLKNISQ